MPSRHVGATPQWMAGFFDGEGCVNITQVGKKRYGQLRVYIVNTDPAVLGLIAATYGGMLTAPRTAKAGWKPFRSVVFIAGSAAEFLEAIRPYVILKKAQVELGLALWNYMQKPGATRLDVVISHQTGRATRVRKPGVTEREAEAKALMNDLNRKGA